MKILMTREYVKQIQFYQMPKAFFSNPKYMPMKCESKLAYMLMLDLLPLSDENNWVNENGEVFVKLSRDKLMTLLNIKGSQKAAQVMKELVTYNLILNKKIGLNRCNEIYLYHLEDPNRTGPTPRDRDPKDPELPKMPVPRDHSLSQQPLDDGNKTTQKEPQETNFLEANNTYAAT